jgi:dihydrofolate reductase
MGTLTVMANLTLDGVVQAPGRPDEDQRDGFAHGGWAVPYQAMALLAERPSPEPLALLLGRRTYQDFAGFWPQHPGNPYSQELTRRRKYVASTTLQAPLPWENSELLGNVPAEVARLKMGPEHLLVMGSGVLCRTLLGHGLVDEWALLVHPLVLGSGRRLFDRDGPLERLELLGVESTPTGVLLARYRPAGPASQDARANVAPEAEVVG